MGSWCLSAGLGATGCATVDYFPGTQIPRTEENRKIVETVSSEQYRARLLQRNVEGLLVLASDKYFEDSGTPRSDDDYGYEGLKQRAGRTEQLKRVKSMRYEIEYRTIKVTNSGLDAEGRGRGVPRRVVRARRRRPAIATAA